ncbi:MAG: efflux RND transporter periplasmic adaptor subunit [Gammaproteobacteria bacterium]|nr:efflux RND transporter periplasmic adaptor subunit [Gammaproteobacteria bacterium]
MNMRIPQLGQHVVWRLLPLLLGLTGCNGNADPGAGMAFPPPQVSVVTVAARDLPVEREYIGQTKGSREVEIRARVGGIIEQRLYEEGTQVAADAVLFQLDPKSYEAQLAVAEAVLARTEAQRNQAEREWNRLKPLAADKVISRKALDDAQSAFELASADVKAAAAAVREARLQLDYTHITAPIAGVVGLAEKVEGAVVKASEERLTTLTVTDPMDVYFSVSENELLAQQTQAADGSLQTPADNALQVKVRLADGRVLDRSGHINFNDARIDTATGTLNMRARLANADGQLKSGQFVRVIVSGALRPNAITVPQKAVLEGPQGKFVYVVGKGKDGAPVAEIRPVDVGEWAGQGEARSWVIRKGLSNGDQVILDNLIKVRPGAPVQIAAPEQPKPPQS